MQRKSGALGTLEEDTEVSYHPYGIIHRQVGNVNERPKRGAVNGDLSPSGTYCSHCCEIVIHETNRLACSESIIAPDSEYFGDKLVWKAFH